MKHLYLCLIVIAAASNLNAQTEKGNVMLGGSLNYHYHHQDNPDNTYKRDHSISAYPTFGVFFKDNWATGFQLIFAYGNSLQVEEPGKEERISEATSLGFRVFMKKYFTVTSKVAFTGTAEASAEVGTSKHSWIEVDPHNAMTNYNIGLRPGLSYFITENLGLEANFGYLGFNYGRQNDGDDNITHHKNFFTQLNPGNIYFGLNFFF